MNKASGSNRSTLSQTRRRVWRAVLLVTVLTGFNGFSQSSFAQTAKKDTKPLRLASVRVTTAPTVDGNGTDPVWRSAKPLEVVAKRFDARLCPFRSHGYTHLFSDLLGRCDSRHLPQIMDLECREKGL